MIHPHHRERQLAAQTVHVQMKTAQVRQVCQRVWNWTRQVVVGKAQVLQLRKHSHQPKLRQRAAEIATRQIQSQQVRMVREG